METLTDEKQDRAVYGACLDRESEKFILVQDANEYQTPLWKFPGGTSEAGETALDTLKREIREEVPQAIIHGIESVLNWDMEHPSPHEWHLFFCNVEVKGDLEPICVEIDRIDLFTWEEIEELIENQEVVGNHASAYRNLKRWILKK